MNLSKNFTLKELTRSDAATRLGLDNTPSLDETENLKHLCGEVLQKVRDHFGPTKVNSGFRSVLVNQHAGGSATSDHCKGMAGDIEVPGVPNAVVAAWIVANCNYTQVILEFYTPGIPDSGWVHVSYNRLNLKKQSLTAMRVGGKVVYKPGLIA